MNRFGRLRLKFYTLKFNKNVRATGRNNKMFKNSMLSVRGGGNIRLRGNNLMNTNVSLMCNQGFIDVGENVTFGKNGVIVSRKKILIGEGTRIGPNVCIYDHDHVFDLEIGVHKSNFNCGDIIIGKNCWIGSNVTILRGSEIGDGCVVGAGVVLSGKILPHTIVKGNRELQMTKIY